jgi:hypothetical protein
LDDLLEKHAPTQLAVLRQAADGSKGARLIDYLALIIAGVAYSYQIRSSRWSWAATGSVRRSSAKARAPATLILSSASGGVARGR